MNFTELCKKRRSVRSFKPDPVDEGLLAALVDAARVAPSAANLQPLEYVVVNDAGQRAALFECLKWAAYTTPRGTPGPGREPTAYVAILANTELKSPVGWEYDVGASAQTILLGAVQAGLGGCWLKAINYPKAEKLLGAPAGLKLDSVLALGHPAEEPVLVELGPDKKGAEVIRYWRDGDEKQFVPKRALAGIIHKDHYGS